MITFTDMGQGHRVAVNASYIVTVQPAKDREGKVQKNRVWVVYAIPGDQSRSILAKGTIEEWAYLVSEALAVTGQSGAGVIKHNGEPAGEGSEQ